MMPATGPTYWDIARTMAALPRPKQRELHCHADVVEALRDALPDAEPEFPWSGAVGSATGIPVIEEPEFMPGVWELREDGKMVSFGVIRR
jgi:hypothetical protein